MKGAACVNAGYTNATKACILFHGRGGKKNHPCGKEVPLAEFVPYLIVCPLVFIAGFVDAVAGGGGLISLPAYLISGIPVHMAIGTNKLSSGMGTALATFRYARSGYVPWKLAAFCAVCALIGSACGAELALLIGDGVFKIIMLVILPLVALYVLRGKALASDTEKEPLCAWKTTAISMAVALIVGAYDGFYGHVPDPAADGACTPLPCRGEWHRKGDQPFHQHRRAHGLSVQRESDFSAWPHGGLFQHCRKLHRHALLCKGRREVREADHPHRAGDLLHKGAHRSAAIAFGRSNRSDGFARVKKVAKGHFFEFSQRLPLADAPGRQTLQ